MPLLDISTSLAEENAPSPVWDVPQSRPLSPIMSDVGSEYSFVPTEPAWDDDLSDFGTPPMSFYSLSPVDTQNWSSQGHNPDVVNYTSDYYQGILFLR